MSELTLQKLLQTLALQKQTSLFLSRDQATNQHRHHPVSIGISHRINFTVSTIIAYRPSYFLGNSSITRSIFLSKNKKSGGTMNLKKVKKKEKKEKHPKVKNCHNKKRIKWFLLAFVC
ncbi:hypothetical protein [Enterococcus hirae]|uniref:hypothetical protein n=1 Tax=Enterococcus hirae TaxID=1354 RepID=UPI00377034AF